MITAGTSPLLYIDWGKSESGGANQKNHLPLWANVRIREKAWAQYRVCLLIQELTHPSQ